MLRTLNIEQILVGLFVTRFHDCNGTTKTMMLRSLEQLNFYYNIIHSTLIVVRKNIHNEKHLKSA